MKHLSSWVKLVFIFTSWSLLPTTVVGDGWLVGRNTKLHFFGRGSISATTLRGGSTTTSTTETTPQSPISPLQADESNSSNSTTAAPIPKWKRNMPESLRNRGNKTLQKLSLGGVDIYLLGTAHISTKSSNQVKSLLETVQPHCIFVELCEARIPLLGDGCTEAQDKAESQNNETTTTSPPKRLPFLQRFRDTHAADGGSKAQALCTALLGAVQDEYADSLDVHLGGEFRTAYQYWLERNANASLPLSSTTSNNDSPPFPPHFILGDRPVALTMMRAWESLSWFGKTKILGGLFFSWVASLWRNPDEIREWLNSVLEEESDVLTESMNELRQQFPTLYATIIAERDAWLAAKLVQTCRQLSWVHGSRRRPSSQSLAPKPLVVVAIVGAGHMPGIVTWLTAPPTTSPGGSAVSSPEAILANLTQTRQYADDEMVQTQLIPAWIRQLGELSYEDIKAAGAAASA